MPRAAVATIIGLLGFALYVGVVVAFADVVLATHWALVAAYFVVVGIAWTWPATWLMRWAVRRA